MEFNRTKKHCRQQIDEFMAGLVGEGYVPADWQLMWYHQYGQPTPRWSDFRGDKDHICAIAPLQLHGRTYWAVVFPPHQPRLSEILFFGFLAMLRGTSHSLQLWETDPRLLPDGPSAYSSNYPGAKRYVIRQAADITALLPSD